MLGEVGIPVGKVHPVAVASSVYPSHNYAYAVIITLKCTHLEMLCIDC